MQPIVNGLETALEGQLVVERLDANSEVGSAVMNRYDLRGHPSYALVDMKDSVLWTGLGPLASDQLLRAVQLHIPPP